MPEAAPERAAEPTTAPPPPAAPDAAGALMDVLSRIKSDAEAAPLDRDKRENP
jgi:hypothetical protein